MIRVQCPHCERRYRTEMGAFGRTAVCTKCSRTFKIGESRPAFAWKPTDIAEDSWIGVEPPEEKQEIRHCIMCDAPLEPDAIRCLACGANQVTGVVQRRRTEPTDEPRSIGSVLPLRTIVLLLIVACIGIGGYWAILLIARSASTVTDDLADQGLAKRAAAFLRDGADERDFAASFGGRVTQENLPRFVRMLGGADSGIRQAAALLIASGEVHDLRPLIDWSRTAEQPEPASRTLHAIGGHRLLELSGDPDENVRLAAAEGLCLASGLTCDAETIRGLAEPVPAAEKIQRLNRLWRLWPEATGDFVAVIDGTSSPFVVRVEQIGRLFYLHVGQRVFSTLWSGRADTLALPEFSIPIERWCEATGIGVDVKGVRESLGGSISLRSPSGAGWQGAVRITGKRDLTGDLPGFLPVPPPARGEPVTAEVRLRRP